MPVLKEAANVSNRLRVEIESSGVVNRYLVANGR